MRSEKTSDTKSEKRSSRKLWVKSLTIALVMVVLSASAAAFNRQVHIDAVQNYAQTWALGRNPAYIDFDPYGGDCAAFVSQSLNQVMSQNSMWKQGTKVLFFIVGNTASWSNADALYDYIINDMSTMTGGSFYVKNAKTTTTAYRPTGWAHSNGSPVFYDWDGNGIYDHAAISTKYQDSKTYVCAHNTDRKNVLWDLYQFMSPVQKEKCKYASISIWA